jgi:hypothetical protein
LIWWMAHLHLLPESYLMGMVDIRVLGVFTSRHQTQQVVV